LSYLVIVKFSQNCLLLTFFGDVSKDANICLGIVTYSFNLSKNLKIFTNLLLGSGCNFNSNENWSLVFIINFMVILLNFLNFLITLLFRKEHIFYELILLFNNRYKIQAVFFNSFDVVIRNPTIDLLITDKAFLLLCSFYTLFAIWMSTRVKNDDVFIDF